MELNVNSEIMINNAKLVELNISITNVSLNTQFFKGKIFNYIQIL